VTEVEFHFNVGDKLAHSCRLLKKAYATGARIIVLAEPETLTQLDPLLWTFSTTDFLPHCRSQVPAATLAASPVLLAATLAGQTDYGVLVNLGAGVPEGFERFERFIEVVSQDPEDVQAGRRRWKHYADRGYALKRHDLAKSVSRPQ